MTPFILRQWQESDAPALAKYLNNKKIWDNCRDSLPCPYTEKDATSFIQHTKSKEIQNNYCIEIRQASGKQVFSIKLASKMDTSWIAIVSSCCKNTHYNHSPLPTSKSAANPYLFGNQNPKIIKKIATLNVKQLRLEEDFGFLKPVLAETENLPSEENPSALTAAVTTFETTFNASYPGPVSASLLPSPWHLRGIWGVSGDYT